MDRYQILLGKKPPKEDLSSLKEKDYSILMKGVQTRGGSARAFNSRDYSHIGVDMASGPDRTAITVGTVRTDGSSSQSFVPVSQSSTRISIPNSGFELGDAVGADNAGIMRKMMHGLTLVGHVVRIEGFNVEVQISNTREQLEHQEAAAQYWDAERQDAERREDRYGPNDVLSYDSTNSEWVGRARPESMSENFNRAYGGEMHLGVLHQHLHMQRRLNIPEDHVIVDKNEWEEARRRLGINDV